MKKHLLIFGSALLFVALFYNQEMGANLSLFASALLILNFCKKPEMLKDKKALLLAGAVVVSVLSNLWLMSFVTVVTVIITSFVMRFYTVNPKMKLITQAVVFVTNWFCFVFQFFQIRSWYDFKVSEKNQIFQKIFSYFVLPFIILGVFFTIYVSTSDTLYDWYHRFEFDIDALIIIVFIFGFYISFVFWHTKIYHVFDVMNRFLKTNFSSMAKENKTPTFDFLPLEFELRSGVITMICLNLMLLFFLIIFNVEHFNKSNYLLNDYSPRTHDQIYSIVASIALAMLVILFYFKGSLNFITNNKPLLTGAKIWMILNAILVLSALYQNSIYVVALGLTYKRLGVYMFLVICLAGLHFTFNKIKHARTNFYLIDRMSWVVFFTLIFCSVWNWGELITQYNLTLKEPDFNYLENQISGNEKSLINFYKKNNLEISDAILIRIEKQQDLPFLSSQVYYKSMNLEE